MWLTLGVIKGHHNLQALVLYLKKILHISIWEGNITNIWVEKEKGAIVSKKFKCTQAEWGTYTLPDSLTGFSLIMYSSVLSTEKKWVFGTLTNIPLQEGIRRASIPWINRPNLLLMLKAERNVHSHQCWCRSSYQPVIF